MGKKITSKWKNHHTYSNTGQNIVETKTNQKGGKGECFLMKEKISQERITILNIMHETLAHTFHRELVTGLEAQINSTQ